MRSNQSILKEVNPEHSLEGLMLKLQHFGHLMLGKTAGKDCWERLLGKTSTLWPPDAGKRAKGEVDGRG